MFLESQSSRQINCDNSSNTLPSGSGHWEKRTTVFRIQWTPIFWRFSNHRFTHSVIFLWNITPNDLLEICVFSDLFHSTLKYSKENVDWEAKISAVLLVMILAGNWKIPLPIQEQHLFSWALIGCTLKNEQEDECQLPQFPQHTLG